MFDPIQTINYIDHKQDQEFNNFPSFNLDNWSKLFSQNNDNLSFSNNNNIDTSAMFLLPDFFKVQHENDSF